MQDLEGYRIRAGKLKKPAAVGRNSLRVVEVMNKIIIYTLSYLRPSSNLDKS
ncbi:MAG: hypothetical protein J7K37_04075 [Candidatus Omnitrophica bacterium]|nr:hypothetical protein [Candidatus Omnitrophota bacterium]